jgi:YVTN family beta-propeller protein
VPVLAALALCLSTTTALARNAYVVNFEDDSVSVFGAQTSQPVGSPIKVGAGPYEIAISPNGKVAYVTNYNAGSVSVINTQTNAVVGSPIAVGGKPNGVAFTPDGKTAYVANEESNSVSVINTQTNAVVGSPIVVGTAPFLIAIAPDGKTAYVSNRESNSVSIINIQTNQVIGSITVESEPEWLAITPGGSALYVVNRASNSVSVVDTHTNQVTSSPIVVGEKPVGIAIAPDGKTAYVSNSLANSVSVINLQTNQVTGSPIPVGEGASGIAITPDQPPLASFSVATGSVIRPQVPIALDASLSSDPDGAIGAYQWSFGDGTTAPSSVRVEHAYRAPGTYTATLTVSDDEGCSAALLFTGQTAFCNGAASASQSQALVVAYPGVRVRCPKSAKPKGCKFKLQAFSKKHAGKPETAVAKAKAGKAAIVALKPTKRFMSKLAGAKTVLVKETTVALGQTRSGYRRLKIVQ